MKRKSYCNIYLILLLVLVACSKGDYMTTAPPPADDMSSIDEQVYSYMAKYTIPGASLAVVKDGKLVYARAYGFANSETAERMTLQTRSRISSISKTITAIAIMKLVEEGKLELDDKIFGPDGILQDDFGSVRPYKTYITDLTIRHCLGHNLGGWANNSSDPTSLHNEMNASQLISYIIDNVPLSAPPGTSYAYSNVGYMILGRVIEKITDRTYEQYVQDDILKPIGITAMEIGGNTFAERKPEESRYHQAGAYTQNFARRDANGGWIATASDLIKLLVRVDGFPSVQDILSSNTLQLMTTHSFNNQLYGLGFAVKGSNWSHGGSFSGSRSQFIRTGSGLVAVLLVNNDATDIESTLNNIVSASVQWPNQNLFE